MAAGKSTFGKKLAKALGVSFVDLDERVRLQCILFYGLKDVSLAAVIDEIGMEKFREKERDVLREMNVEDTLVSTGGGTPCHFDNLDWMKINGVVVFLNTSPEIILGRLRQSDLNARPLLKGLDDEGLRQFIHDKLEERMPYYIQAHIHFVPHQDKQEKLVSDLLNKCS